MLNHKTRRKFMQTATQDMRKAERGLAALQARGEALRDFGTKDEIADNRRRVVAKLRKLDEMAKGMIQVLRHG